jgi:hypothetical protein
VNISPELQAIADSVSDALAQKPEHFVKHPAEIKVLQELSDDELRDFAHDRGWSVIKRLGGMQIQFYNDNDEQRRPETNEV